MSGSRRGIAGAAGRAALSMVEPFYARAATLRNQLFDRNAFRSFTIDRAVISIGNLTTGGTGKTPIVAWLSRRLRDLGHRPAILLRGYKSHGGGSHGPESGGAESHDAESDGGGSDEAALLSRLAAPSPVIARADRVSAAMNALRADPSIDCFLLDDGFQHRRLRRDCDLVLIDVTRPFGFDHVLPRGLLREPVKGLRRCDGVVFTRCERATAAEIGVIARRVSDASPHAPQFQCAMHLAAFADESDRKLEQPDDANNFAFCGIGNSDNFFVQLAAVVGPLKGARAFPDHHAYQTGDVRAVIEQARAAGATRLITTEKDWVKIRPLLADVTASGRPEFWRALVDVRFSTEDEAALLALIRTAIAPKASAKK